MNQPSALILGGWKKQTRWTLWPLQPFCLQFAAHTQQRGTEDGARKHLHWERQRQWESREEWKRNENCTGREPQISAEGPPWAISRGQIRAAGGGTTREVGKEPSKKRENNTQGSLMADNNARLEKSTVHRLLGRILRKSPLPYREELTPAWECPWSRPTIIKQPRISHSFYITQMHLTIKFRNIYVKTKICSIDLGKINDVWLSKINSHARSQKSMTLMGDESWGEK